MLFVCCCCYLFSYLFAFILDLLSFAVIEPINVEYEEGPMVVGGSARGEEDLFSLL